MTIKKTFASSVILMFIALQSFVTFGPELAYQGGFFWPFLNYPMYTFTHDKHDPVNQYSVYVVHPDGTEDYIAPDDLGMNFYTFSSGPLGAFQQKNQAKINKYARLYEKRKGKLVSAFRLENQCFLLTEKGPCPLPLTRTTFAVGDKPL